MKKNVIFWARAVLDRSKLLMPDIVHSYSNLRMRFSLNLNDWRGNKPKWLITCYSLCWWWFWIFVKYYSHKKNWIRFLFLMEHWNNLRFSSIAVDILTRNVLMSFSSRLYKSGGKDLLQNPRLSKGLLLRKFSVAEPVLVSNNNNGFSHPCSHKHGVSWW